MRIPQAGAVSSQEARYERERQYHDERFAGGSPRERAARWYRVDAARRRYAEILSTVPAGARVLEYGCGAGSSAFTLARRGVEVLGIDLSPVAIDRARRRAVEEGLDTATFEVMNAEALAVPPASVDVVCGSGILHHLDLGSATAEVRRVLRSDGFALFVEPLGTNPIINLYRRLTPSMRTADEHPLLDRDLLDMAEAFSQVTIEHHNLLSLGGALVAPLPGGRGAVDRLQRIDAWLFERSALARRLAWIVLIQLRP